MAQPFVCTLPRKIIEILRFLPPKNFRRFFHEILIAKVLLTPKPCGATKFRECELLYGGDTTAGEEKRSEGNNTEGFPMDALRVLRTT